MLASSCLGPLRPYNPSAVQTGETRPVSRTRVLCVCRANSTGRSASPRVPDRLRSSWRTELSPPESNNNYSDNGSAWQKGYGDDDVATGSGYTERVSANGHASTSYAAQHREEAEGDDGATEGSAVSGTGLFTDAFKEALKQALQRSPLYDNGFGAGSDNEEDVPPQPTESEIERFDQPIFTDQFRAVLKQSLERQQAELDKHAGGFGSDEEYTPTPYTPSPPPPRELSPMEEILTTALGSAHLSLRRLTLLKQQIDAAIEREAKQVERLDFALRKTQSDQAYYSTMERMMQEKRQR